MLRKDGPLEDSQNHVGLHRLLGVSPQESLPEQGPPLPGLSRDFSAVSLPLPTQPETHGSSPDRRFDRYSVVIHSSPTWPNHHSRTFAHRPCQQTDRQRIAARSTP